MDGAWGSVVRQPAAVAGRFLRMLCADLSIGGRGADEGGTGWVADSVFRSIRRMAMIAAASWQVVMIGATASSLGRAGWPLQVAHVCLGVLALLAIKVRIPDPVVPFGMVAVALWAELASRDVGSALVFAAVWQVNFASCVIGLVILRWYAAPLVLAVTAVVAVLLMRAVPHWGSAFIASMSIAQVSIIVALKWGLAVLRGLAIDADRDVVAAEEATRRTEVAAQASIQLAEESRVLHDTAVNTLGAITNGSVGVANVGQVREQCARDIGLLHLLRSEQASAEPPGLRDVFGQPGLPIGRWGMGDDDLAIVEEVLPASQVTALVYCVREAVTNATKHSGADRIEVDLRASATILTVEVRDAGRGFDSGRVGVRGIDGSILGRARDHGFVASVRSMPGAGTTVTFEVPLREQPLAEPGADDAVRRPIGVVLWRAGEMWAIGATAVSIALPLGGEPNPHGALFPMIGLMVLAWAAARFTRPPRDRASLRILLTLATCATFFLSAAATSFGTVGGTHWHALAPSAPFVLLLTVCAHRRDRLLAAAAWALLVAAIAAAISTQSVAAAQIVVVAGCVGLGFSGAWASFQGLLSRMGEAAAAARRQTLLATLKSDLDAAAQARYRRWMSAGLDSAIELLDAIAAGVRDPHDADTRQACGDEERYLRQLIQIGPELVNLGGELTPILKYAREREVDFTLKLGGADAPDQESARSIAATLADNLDAMAPGASLAASLFPVDQGLRLTLVGRGLTSDACPAGSTRHERFGSFELIEASYGRTIPERSR